MAKYFGTNGARGTFQQLSPELVMKLSQAIGLYFNKGKILLARDGRLTGETLKHAAVSGLLSVGCTVVELGMVSSPTAEYMVRKLNADGLIIITASHNPPEWNGLKVVDSEGIAISKERGGEIEKLMDGIEIAGWDKTGKLRSHEGSAEEHIEEILGHIDVDKVKKKKPKIVLDCGNGMASVIAPKLFSSMGCEVIPLNSHVDGTFPGRPSEPTEANVKEMLALVKETKADAGIAWDGDADRVVFADEKGNFVIGDKVFALCVILKLKEKKGKVVSTVATSLAIEEIARKNGAEVVYTKIGAPYLSEAVAKGAVIGGEEVGGIIFPEISFAKEGLFASAKIVEALCTKSLSEWLKEIPEYRNIKEKVPADEAKAKKMITAAKKYAEENKLDYVDIDGIKINYENSWVIIRPSGTEAYVRIFAEAKTAEEAKELIKKHEKIVSGE